RPDRRAVLLFRFLRIRPWRWELCISRIQSNRSFQPRHPTLDGDPNRLCSADHGHSHQRWFTGGKRRRRAPHSVGNDIEFIAATLADGAGNYSLNAAANGYVVLAAKPGYVSDLSVAPTITLNSGQVLT